VPKVTTQEVEAVVPAVITPEKSVPTKVGVPPVTQAVSAGAGLPVERIWPGKYTPLLVSTPKAPVASWESWRALVIF